jgi:hypothetical protein
MKYITIFIVGLQGVFRKKPAGKGRIYADFSAKNAAGGVCGRLLLIAVGRGDNTPPHNCHSEPVTDVTGVGIRNSMPKKKKRIATPVCGLARNDRNGGGGAHGHRPTNV